MRDIQAMVLGGHGDTMVPLISYTSVSGIPITQLMTKDKLDAIVDRTRNGGAEIVKHLKTGSAYYAPSAGAVQMAEAIVNDQRRILPCAAWLEGEYGMKDLFLGVPCKLGRNGLEKVIEVELTADERAALAEERRGGSRADARGEAVEMLTEPIADRSSSTCSMSLRVLSLDDRQEDHHGGHGADRRRLRDPPHGGQSPGVRRPVEAQRVRRAAARAARRAHCGCCASC